MKAQTLFGATVIAASLVSRLFTWQGFALLPLPFLWSILITYAVRRPGRWLAALAAACELLTSLPPGVMTFMVFLPWLVRYFNPALAVDISLRFFLTIGGTVFLQLGVLVVALNRSGEAGQALADWWRFFPWPAAPISFLATAAAATALLVAHTYVFVDNQRA